MKEILCMFLAFAMAMSVMQVRASENAEDSFEFGDSDHKSIKTSVKTFEGDEEIHQTKITVQNKITVIIGFHGVKI